MKRQLAGWAFSSVLSVILPVHAGAPLDTVQTNVNKVLDVLRDPTLKAESAKEIKKEKLGRSMTACSMKSNFPGEPWRGIGTN